MKIVIVGGTGQIGRQAAAQLKAEGHQTVIASPSRGVNTLSGEGLDEALGGADVVVDVSNSPSLEDQTALDFFTRSASNLVAASVRAGLKHLIALSIVGADQVRGSGYFEGKVAQERAFQSSGIPHTILRATQFFELIDTIAAFGTHEGAVRVTTAAFQPVAAADVAAEVVRLTTAEPANGIVEIAGPERRGMAEFVAAYLLERGDARQVLADPAAGYFGASIEEKTLVPQGAARLGRTPFRAWVRPLVTA